MEMSLGYKFFYDDHNTFSHFSWSRRKLKEQAKGDERCVDYVCAQVQAYHRFPSPRFKQWRNQWVGHIGLGLPKI